MIYKVFAEERLIKRHTNLADVKKPNLFIIGYPKTGTTALWWFLKQHPDIFMTEVKEPYFFASDRLTSYDALHRSLPRFSYKTPPPCRTLKEYNSLFSRWKTEKIAGEASASYSYSRCAAKNLHAFNPSAKIILIIREPVEYLYSSFSQHQWMGSEKNTDFQTVIRSQMKRKQENAPDLFNVVSPDFRYLERAKYTEHIQRYFDLFDKKQIKIIIYDDFKKDNAKVYKEVLEFLEVNPTFTPEFKILNPRKIVRFRTLRDIILIPAIYKTLKALVSLKPFRGLKTLYETKITRTQPRPPLEPAFKNELMKKCKPEVEKLSALLNRDLVSLWGYNKI